MGDVIASGDTISVHYTGTFENGEVFDSSRGRDPLTFTVGAGQVIKGFDQAVVGLAAGADTTVVVQPDDGYGQRRDDMVVDFPRSNVPEGMELEQGMQVQLRSEDGRPIPAMIASFDDTVVKVDMNHPLAGKTLVFNIEVVATGVDPIAPPCGGSGGCDSCCGGCDS